MPWTWQSVPAVHRRDARARRLPALGLGAGCVRAAPARARRRRGDRERDRATGSAGRGAGLLATTPCSSPSRSSLWLSTSTFVEPGSAFFRRARDVRTSCSSRRRRRDTVRSFSQERSRARSPGSSTSPRSPPRSSHSRCVAAASFAADASAYARRRSASPFVVALPWYVKNAVLTGDPAYPVLLGWPNEQAQAEAQASFDNYGHGHSPLDLVLLPLRLLADAERFDRAEYISPLFLLFAPLALLRDQARAPSSRSRSAAAQRILVVWFFAVQDARYLVSVHAAAGGARRRRHHRARVGRQGGTDRRRRGDDVRPRRRPRGLDRATPPGSLLTRPARRARTSSCDATSRTTRRRSG